MDAFESKGLKVNILKIYRRHYRCDLSKSKVYLCGTSSMRVRASSVILVLLCDDDLVFITETIEGFSNALENRKDSHGRLYCLGRTL